MRVEIVASDLVPLSWALRQRTANAQRSWQTRAVVLLRVRASDGTLGWGEAAPLPGFSTDSLDACRAELSSAVMHCGPLQTGDPIEQTLRAAVARARVRSPAAIFCLESALLDVLGKIRGEPAWRLLRPDATSPAPVPLAALLRETAPDAIANEARSVIARGVRAVKLKDRKSVV